MTQTEYEQSKRRLEEQRRAGVELVERAYEAQIRALELVWRLQGGAATLPLPAAAVAAAPSPLPPPVSPRKTPHKLGAEVMADVQARLPELPEVFTQHDLCQALGYQPDRAVLYRVLRRSSGTRPSSWNPTASGGGPRRIAKPEPSIRRGPREGWNPRESIRSLLPDIRSGFSLDLRGLRSGATPVASIRPALRRDPRPRTANRTGFPFNGTGFRPNHSSERLNGCAERTVRSAVPCEICGVRLNGRGFRFARSAVRLNAKGFRFARCPVRTNRISV